MKVAKTWTMICSTKSKMPWARASNRSVYRSEELGGARSTKYLRKVKKGYLTYAQALAEIQASEAELTKALKDRRILLINGSRRFRKPLISLF